MAWNLFSGLAAAVFADQNVAVDTGHQRLFVVEGEGGVGAADFRARHRRLGGEAAYGPVLMGGELRQVLQRFAA